MINEYYTEANYRNRGKDWFSDTLELTKNLSESTDKKDRIECDLHGSAYLYKKNTVYIETVNADEHCRRGFFTAMMGFPCLVFSSFFIFSTSLPIKNMVKDGFLWADVFVAIFCVMVAMVAVAFFSLLHLGKDWFSYRHAAIRFNRKARQVHVFYSPKLGGPRSYGWDDILASITPFNGGEYYVLNMVAADPKRERFYDTFPVGGELVKREDCLAWWEYIRRYMEEGPDSVPEPDWYLSDRLSLKESFLRWFPLREMKRDKARGMDVGHARRKMLLMSPLLTLFSLGHFVSMLTSKRVTWPEDIRKACEEA